MQLVVGTWVCHPVYIYLPHGQVNTTILRGSGELKITVKLGRLPVPCDQVRRGTGTRQDIRSKAKILSKYLSVNK